METQNRVDPNRMDDVVPDRSAAATSGSFLPMLRVGRFLWKGRLVPGHHGRLAFFRHSGLSL